MKPKYFILIVAGIVIPGLIIYWLTAYPSITWWESSEYSAAAVCLGLTGAPGSIILTMMGWILSKFSPGNPAYLFNLSSGVIASLIVLFSFLAAMKITGEEISRSLFVRAENFQPRYSFFKSLFFHRTADQTSGKVIINEAQDFVLLHPIFISLFFVVTAWIILCSSTLWEYAINFTPYILTALFTMFILMALIFWQKNADRADSWKYIFIIALLSGMDFSVHRTNAVLIPGMILYILILDKRTFLKYRSYLAAFIGLILGLSLQLLYIPMSWRDPALNLGETNNLSAWWDFISLKQYGGHFLTDILQRKGPLWSYQIPYYLKGFARNFFLNDGFSHFFGYVPGILGLAGIWYLWKADKKSALAWILLFLFTISISIIYFNLPQNYFRTIYRHYLPTFMIFSVFIFYGIAGILKNISTLKVKYRWIAYAGLLLVLLGSALSQYLSNIQTRNGSGWYFAEDHAKNLMDSVEKDGILFSYADNHLFPELYLQISEKYRTDITHCNLSLMNLEWYLNQLKRHHPGFPFSGNGIDTRQVETTIHETPRFSFSLNEIVRESYGSIQDSFRLTLPAIRGNNSVLLQDLVLFDIIRNNQWGRPLYFVKQGFDRALYDWLKPFLSDEGLVYKLRPDSVLPVNTALMKSRLDNLRISGFHDEKVILDEISRGAGIQYLGMFLTVIRKKAGEGDLQAAAALLNQVKTRLPSDRLMPDAKILEEIRELEAKCIP